jgi:GWxTD domain-containing protein
MTIHRATLAAAAFVALAAGAPRAQPAGAPGAHTAFGLYANAFLDSTRAPATRVTVEVPFRNLIFFKKQGVYDTRYEVYLSIWNAEGDLVGTYVIQGSATVQSYEETRKRELRSRTSRVLRLQPGEYEIEGTLRVKQTQIAARRSVALRVPDFLASGIGFGTPLIMMVPTRGLVSFATWRDFQAAHPTAPAFVDSSDMDAFDRQPILRFELFLEQPVAEPIPCNLYYEVVDAAHHQVAYGKREVMITGRNDAWVVGFNVDQWEPGRYTVNLRAITRSPERDATASADLRIDVTRAMLGPKFDETLEILALIAPKDELEGLRDAQPSERAAEWAKFWKTRDPDPSTDSNEALQQYIARVRYVEEHFSQLGAGWRSDRGRIFIRFGQPEQIDRAADQRGQGDYEIWRYYSLDLTFVFYDMFGVGDYRLVQGDLY